MRNTTNMKKLSCLLYNSFLLLCLSALMACSADASKGENTDQNPPKYYVYLTFDDGPLNGSENIDSVILAEKIKISVFLVGEHVAGNRKMDTYFKYYEGNPYIDEYNHSFSHAKNHYERFYMNTKGAVDDIKKNQQFLKLHYKIVRLPGRNMWRTDGRKRDDEKNGSLVADGLQALGYKVVGWDVEWEHKGKTGAPKQTVAQMLQEIKTRCEKGSVFTKNNIVVLLHDEMFQKKWEESELKQLIDALRSDGQYEFEQIRFYPQ
jgi:peptidoglycan/xylan/chitin deacetylase (PgdA/CDA1 family)